MKLNHLLIILVLFVISSCSDSTSPENEDFTVKDVTKFKGVTGRRLALTNDNNMVICVDKGTPGIIKCDLNGNIIWEKYYSIGCTSSYTNFICELSDGGFLLTGDGRTSLGTFVIKTDSDGNLLWIDSLQSSYSYRKAQENNKGEIILVTSTKVMKFDEDGNEIWSTGHNYFIDDVYLQVHIFYDFAISEDNDIYLVYRSAISTLDTLVKIIIDDNGDFKSGEFYDINSYNGCIFFKGDTHYIFGGYNSVDDELYSFLYKFYGPTFISDAKSYDMLNTFTGYDNANLSDTGNLVATDDNRVIKFDQDFNFDWMYETDWTTTDDDFCSSVEIENDKMMILGNTEWTENDFIVHGSFLKHLTKN